MSESQPESNNQPTPPPAWGTPPPPPNSPPVAQPPYGQAPGQQYPTGQQYQSTQAPLGYQTPSPYGPDGPPPSAISDTERNWAVAANLTGFLAAYLALGFLGPLTILLVAGQKSPFIRRHAMEALNFNLTVLIYFVISLLALLILAGFVMLPALGLLYLVASIRGAIAASQGRLYRYPVTIRFFS